MWIASGNCNREKGQERRRKQSGTLQLWRNRGCSSPRSTDHLSAAAVIFRYGHSTSICERATLFVRFQWFSARARRTKFERQVEWDQSNVREVFCLLHITTWMWDACYRLVNMKAKGGISKTDTELSESYEPTKNRFHVLKTVCMIWKVRGDTCAMRPSFHISNWVNANYPVVSKKAKS